MQYDLGVASSFVDVSVSVDSTNRTYTNDNSAWLD
jgi:hypothetical protein